MSAHHDYRTWGKLSHHSAHLTDLADVHDDRRDANDVVVVRGQFPSKSFPCGKIQHAAGSRDICLNQHDAPGAMEHAQREAALRAGNLVVIELHGIDGSASKFVILRIGPEDRTQQDARSTSLGVSFHTTPVCRVPSAELCELQSRRRLSEKVPRRQLLSEMRQRASLFSREVLELLPVSRTSLQLFPQLPGIQTLNDRRW